MKTIILLHGALGAKDQLEPLLNELEGQGFQAYALNFSGHGKLPFQNRFGIGQFASEVESFINDQKLITPTIFGYSMGGYVALYLAKQQPELLGNIFTLGTKFEWTPEIAQREIKMLDSKTIIEKVPKFAEALKVRHGNEWDVLLKKTSELMLDLGNSNTLSLEDFSLLKNQISIGIADKDNMVSLEETSAVYKQLKDGVMYMLPHTKHPIETVNVSLLGKIISEISSITKKTQKHQ